MFLGHFGVAFAAKRAVPQVSLGVLFAAAQLADLLWPILVLAGIERFAIAPGITAVTPLDFQHYPYSHSLATLVAWGLAFGFGYRFLRGGGYVTVTVIAAVVVSHWALDFVSHRPDMPIVPGSSEKVGLGLWQSVPGTLVVELGFFAAAVWFYARTTKAVDRVGRWAFYALVVFFTLVYLANLFGPPPPSVPAVAWSAMAMWLLVAWGCWIDRHRVVRS